MARPLLLLVALVGLFAMHGLSDHGGSAHASMPAADVAMADHPMVPAAADPLPDPAPALAADDQPAEHSELGLAGLCLAVLAAAVLGVALIRRRVMAYVGVRSPRLGHARPRSAGRDRDPPDLIRLSIQRC